MSKKSLVSEILKLEEIPTPEDKNDPIPDGVARQIQRTQPDEKVLDEAFRTSRQVTEERKKQRQCVIALYEKRFGQRQGKRHGVTLKLDRCYERNQVLGLMQTEYAPEREYAEKHRPKKREECEGGARPCPWVSCHYHLATDTTANGSIKLNFPNLKPGDELPEIDFDSMLETCALDVADEEGRTLEEVGVYINLTRTRIQQCEKTALIKMEESGVLNKLVNPRGLPNPTGHFEQHGGNGNGNGKSHEQEPARKDSDEIDFSLDGGFKNLKL